MKPHAASLQRRIARHRELYSRRTPGDLLVYINWMLRTPSLETFLCQRLHAMGMAALQPQAVEEGIREYVGRLRKSYASYYAIDDDSVPCAIVYWGIGGVTAAMVGRDPVHDGMTSWLEPNLSWPEIEKLAFNPDNKWLGFARDINRALWKHWEEDFLVMPYLHRSPLDAANGIHGTELFVDMYEDPARVKALTNWCADWSIAVERRLKAEVPRPAGWGTAVWGTWLPDDSVFINGDPVGLISRETAEEFDRPYTEKLFTQTGGGFFHNHTVGLYQADLVSTYRGNHIQWFIADPKQPSLSQALLEMPALRDKLLKASLQCPIGGFIWHEDLDAVLDVVKDGRFILSLWCPEGLDTAPLIRKVRAASKIQ